MLHEFVTTYRDAIIARSREKLAAREWPRASKDELENGVPVFLGQLADALREDTSGKPPSSTSAIGVTATSHGRALLALGFTVSQVVHDYGDICQAVTELALEQNAPITTEEFKTLNGCLDTAIAEAVTEHARITAESRSTDVERTGHAAHETRDLLNTALLAFESLKRGAVAVNGSTGAVLGRSLLSLRDLVETTLTDVRAAASSGRPERVAVAPFLNDIAVAARLHAEYRGLRFATDAVDPGLAMSAEPETLAAAVANLLNNAFKYTRPGSRVMLRANATGGRVLIEVEDECGGIPDSTDDPFKAFGPRRGSDRTGLGLGLAIARKAVRAHGGEISIRNMPGQGCVFTIDVPRAEEQVADPRAVV